MITTLSEEELEFMECFYDPIALSECLFGDVDNLGMFYPERTSHVRLGQISLLSFEYLLDDKNPKLTEKENFKLREGAGSTHVFGGRKFGKSLYVLIIDLMVSMVLLDGESAGFTSLDAIHIRGVLDVIVRALENHKFYQLLEPKITRSPTYNVFLNNGYHLISVNMNLHSNQPGNAFFQKHFRRLYIEEGSFESEVVFNKRQDSISEDGCVIRNSGMTNFTKYSPAGKVFYDISEKPKVINLPQYINPKWGKKEKIKMMKKYGGESSLGYRIFVKGEVVEEGVSALDMERVRENYSDEKKLKRIEINKDNINNLKNILFLDRPKNSEMLFVDADIGETAPTEIIIISKVNEKYRYLYNITAYNLTDKEQVELFSYIISQTKADVVGLDTTDGLGRAIFRALKPMFPEIAFCWCSFNEKIAVDFERNDNNKILFKNGQLAYKEEYVSEWSFMRLRELFYKEVMMIPVDFKLDEQLNSIIAIQGATRITYPCVASEDHLYAAFLVFAISQWYIEFNLIKPKNRKTFCKRGI